ncbi:MAG: response regulator, partial [Myxococcales bacterium]|nr:response regulator [Myxococcales bacterium]
MPTVLVVEDEGIIAADICATLRALGHEVPATVDSAEDAVHAAEALRPSLVLMDVRLRDDGDGIQAA